MPQAETSRAAYEKVKSEGIDKTHADIVYNALVNRPNRMGTASDIAVHCKLEYYKVLKRLPELVAAGKIEIAHKSGGRTTGGNACRIYRAIVESREPVTNTEQTTLF